ncbi:hypothetical protein [Accumulibacter sp.]|uniref:hypothetical protein n=1 Tax=Accumulibacter sp. TaxID=2053492 RepID=UPI00260650A9|nr:hypothetical protein [Accumulibacter sp.]
MNAPEMLSRLRTPQADGLVLQLKTLTPLYTGGIGQLGDQVHPSNLLGGIRQMSCLVARTLGDDGFERAVWGNAGTGQAKAEAKQVALRWETAGLEAVKLPEIVKLPKATGGDSRWYFNSAFEGQLGLQISRRGIADAHWQLLTLGLAIQLRHGSFGAKDQFGLGVLALAEGTRRFAVPLDTASDLPKVVPATPGQLNLLRHAFGRLRFRIAPGQRPILNRSTALNLALATRATLRNALRARPDASGTEQARLTVLRHQMLGKLNQFGSAVNVSAAYATESGVEVRLAVALKPEVAAERSEVMKAFAAAAVNIDAMIERIGYRVDGKIDWEFGGAHLSTRAAWLNKLAGV